LDDVARRLYSLQTTLTTLLFANVCDGNEVAQILVKSLSGLSSLTYLSLFEGALLEAGVTSLIQGLRQSSSLRTLCFEGCFLDDRGVELLVENWHPSLPIRRLGLSDKNIGSKGLQMLLCAVATDHMPLHELKLELYDGMGYEELQMIGKALPNLTHLTKISCFIYRREWYRYRRNEDKEDARQRALEAVLDGVKKALRIKEFDISDYLLSSQLEKEIEFYATLIKSGRYLLSVHHGLASTVWCFIMGQCTGEHAPSLVYYFLREQPSLVQQP
jgi:hypothetical protein